MYLITWLIRIHTKNILGNVRVATHLRSQIFESLSDFKSHVLLDNTRVDRVESKVEYAVLNVTRVERDQVEYSNLHDFFAAELKDITPPFVEGEFVEGEDE